MERPVFITGGTGFVGVHAAIFFRQRGIPVVLGTRWPHRYAQTPLAPLLISANILDQQELFAAIEKIRPALILHTAALSQPLQAERNPVRALEVNVVGTSNVIGVAAALNIPLIFLSTDLVFDGRKGWYTEDEPPQPVIEYGKTKVAAEALFQRQMLLTQWSILRVSLMFGQSLPWNPAYPGFAVQKLQRGESVTLFVDQYRTPVWVEDVLEAIWRVWMAQHWQTLYHIGGPQRINRVDFVVQYCQRAGIAVDQVLARSMADVPGYPTQVRDVSLDSRQFQQQLSWKPTPLPQAFDRLIEAPPLLEQLALVPDKP